MEERRKAFNARESLQGEYPTPEQRHREVNQAFAIVILSCMFLAVTVAWIVNMKWDSDPAPVAESMEMTVAEGKFITRKDSFATNRDTGEKYYFVMVRDNTQ